jgi:hypothetical protein
MHLVTEMNIEAVSKPDYKTDILMCQVIEEIAGGAILKWPANPAKMKRVVLDRITLTAYFMHDTPHFVTGYLDDNGNAVPFDDEPREFAKVIAGVTYFLCRVPEWWQVYISEWYMRELAKSFTLIDHSAKQSPAR